MITQIKNQGFWYQIFLLSLKQMNFGNGGNFTLSGEMFILKYISDKLKKESSIIIFDVGANIGNYSKELSNFFGSNAIIFSFEPSRKTFDKFIQTTKNIDNIIPNNIGFSDKESTQTLFTDIEGSGLASVYKRKLEHFGVKMDITEEIELTTIDKFCSDNEIETIHFLKLDIEGHELSALQGAIKMINDKRIEFIQFEFGGCNIDSRTYFQDFFYLLKDNYRIYRILKDDICELASYSETYEIFITSNYLAIRK